MTGSSNVLTGDAVAKNPTARRTVGPLLRISWGARCGITTRPPASTSSSCSAILATAAGALVLAGVVVCAVCGWFDDSPVVPRNGGLLEGRHAIAVVFLVALIVAFAAYLVALWALRNGGRVRLVIALAVAIQLVPLATPLLLSSDAYSYWAYAKVDNPYSNTPSEAGVAARSLARAEKARRNVV